MVYKNLSSQRQTKRTEENKDHMKTASFRGKEEHEALKETQALMNSASSLKGKADDQKEEEKKAKSMWDCGSPLYDSYELVSLDHLIDRHLMAFPSSLHGSKPIITRFTHHSHDMVSEVAHKVESPEKSKGSFIITSLSNLLVKIRKMKTVKKEEHEKRPRWVCS